MIISNKIKAILVFFLVVTTLCLFRFVYFKNSSVRRQSEIKNITENTLSVNGIIHITDSVVSRKGLIYLNDVLAKNIDHNTFSLIQVPYYADRNSTYFFDGKKESNIIKIANSNNIKILTNDTEEGGYVLIGGQVFYGSNVITGADVKSFYVLDGDVSSGYRGSLSCDWSIYCPYAKDTMNVYFKGKIVQNADPKTFTLLGYGVNKGKDMSTAQPNYGKDLENAYYKGNLIPRSDAGSFEPVKSGDYFFEYAKDSKNVYWKDELIFGADPLTFHTYDGQQAYEGCTAGRYSYDKNAVYYKNTIVKGADIKTFKVIIGDGDFAEDKNNFYLNGQVTDRKVFKKCSYG